MPWLTLSELMAWLPRLRNLAITSHRNIHPSYHPSHPRLGSFIHTASQMTIALTTLIIRRVQFSAAADVLRLLSFFPRLTVTELQDCGISFGSGIVPCAPSTRLEIVSVGHSDSEKAVLDVASLTQWWQWPHISRNSQEGLFPGLHKLDGAIIRAMLPSLIAGVRSVPAMRIRYRHLILLPRVVELSLNEGLLENTCKSPFMPFELIIVILLRSCRGPRRAIQDHEPMGNIAPRYSRGRSPRLSGIRRHRRPRDERERKSHEHSHSAGLALVAATTICPHGLHCIHGGSNVTTLMSPHRDAGDSLH